IWSSQGRKTLDPLAFGAQPFATGCQNVNTLGAFENRLRQDGSRLQDALAAVQHEQHLHVLEESNDASQWLLRANGYAEKRCNGTWHQERIRQRCQIDEADAVLV